MDVADDDRLQPEPGGGWRTEFATDTLRALVARIMARDNPADLDTDLSRLLSWLSNRDRYWKGEGLDLYGAVRGLEDVEAEVSADAAAWWDEFKAGPGCFGDL